MIGRSKPEEDDPRQSQGKYQSERATVAGDSRAAKPATIAVLMTAGDDDRQKVAGELLQFEY